MQSQVEGEKGERKEKGDASEMDGFFISRASPSGMKGTEKSIPDQLLIFISLKYKSEWFSFKLLN